MRDHLRVTVDDGKYTVVQEKSGLVSILRHGTPWVEDPAHARVILAMAHEIRELREELIIHNSPEAAIKKYGYVR